MSPLSLPNHATTASMRAEVDRLCGGFDHRDPAALALVQRHDPPAGPTLSSDAARLVVARAHGFRSWPALEHYFHTIDGHRSDGSPEPVDDTPADRFCRLATLAYDGDDPERRVRAAALLAEVPDLVDVHIWAAATAGDPDAVRRHLQRDPGLATRRGGPHGWSPLYHLVYSRVTSATGDALRTARLLLAAGADPDEGYSWAGQPTPFTLLTGVFGEGEGGPEAQPAHPHALALARLLLEAGADPNDAQTLYNRMFRPADDHLELLFAFGLGTGDSGPWRRLLGDALDPPAALLRGQLSWAVDHGFADRVRLLLAQGVDPRLPLPDGRDPVAAALLSGQGSIAAQLRAAGAPAPDLDPADALTAAVMAGEPAAVGDLVATGPDVTAIARRRRPGLMVWAAARHRPDVVRLLAAHGWDPNALGRGDTPGRQEWETALHHAAGDGVTALVTLLLELGADPTITDRRFGMTAAGWARHFGHDDVAASLERPRAGAEPLPTTVAAKPPLADSCSDKGVTESKDIDELSDN